MAMRYAGEPVEWFPQQFRRWLHAHGELLEGIVWLRGVGRAADDALRQALAHPAVRELDLAWQLFEILVDADGGDPDGLLTTVVRFMTIERARYALHGWPTATGSAAQPRWSN